MDAICAYYGITRQAHYQMLRREANREREELLVLELVRQIRRKHPRMGGRKLLVKLEPMMSAEGLGIGRDRLFDLLRREDLLVKRCKAQRRTTFSGWWRTPNLLPGLTITRPNQVWVSDITYLETETQPFVYLFLLMDLYSRYLLGWHVSDSLAANGAQRALQMALQQSLGGWQGLIHHSDHGVQYTSSNYLATLSDYTILPSMGEVGNCYDNVFAERVIGTLKGEYRLEDRLTDIFQAEQLSREAVFLYNTDRPHLALNYAVPREVYFGHISTPFPIMIPAQEEYATEFQTLFTLDS
jgi:transposase InsO family protein